MVIRIAYFSWKGHTEKVASALANLLDAELVRIEPLAGYQVGRGGLKALFTMKSPIKPTKSDLNGIDTLVVACPVWSGKVPPYVNAYLESVENGSGKPFHVLVEMGGRGDQSAIAVVRTALEKKGMKFGTSVSTIEKDVDGGSFMGTLENFAAAVRNT